MNVFAFYKPLRFVQTKAFLSLGRVLKSQMGSLESVKKPFLENGVRHELYPLLIDYTL